MSSLQQLSLGSSLGSHLTTNQVRGGARRGRSRRAATGLPPPRPSGACAYPHLCHPPKYPPADNLAGVM